MPYFLYSLNPVHCDHPSLAAMYSLSKLLPFIYQKERLQCKSIQVTDVASRRRTEALASVKFYQILSFFIFFIRLIILEDFIRLISYNGPCARLGCSFFLATALKVFLHPTPQTGVCGEGWKTSSPKNACVGGYHWDKYCDNFLFVLLGVYVKIVKRKKSLSLLIGWDYP